MEKSNIFQVIVLTVLGFAILIAVLIFSGILPGFGGGSAGTGGNVVIWGVFPERSLEKILADFNRAHNKEFSVTYVYHNKEEIESDYLQARARGGAPDIILAQDNFINRYRNTFFRIPFSSYSLRTFKDTFTDGTEIFLSADSLVAVPLLVDPLVMYYNKDLLASSGIINPPRTWSDVLVQLKNVNNIGSNNNINQTFVALGDFTNIKNAKSIFETLLFQAGNPIVTLNNTDKRFTSTFGSNLGFAQIPAVAVVDFFSQFAMSEKSVYSWSPALPEDRKFFTAGKLATYFGLGSELADIRSLNPNLNFDIAPIPQRDSNDKKVTKADFYGLAITNNSTNFDTAFQVTFLLADSIQSRAFAEALALAPARRDVLTQSTSNPLVAVFYTSALFSRSWFDPSPEVTKSIFARLVKRVVTKQNLSVSEVSSASLEISNLLNK